MAATQTPYLYLNKPDRDDYVSVITDINDNMNKIDESAQMVETGMAIVIDGDEAPKAITSGQYLFIKNHSTLATGGYHATANISLGASITSSNVAADADGIANALNSNIESIANNLNASKMRFCIVRNSDNFTFDCGESTDATAFVFNGNQSVCGYFDLGLGSTPTVTYRDLTGTTSGWTITKSGTTITLTRTNGTMWGMACLIVALR